MPDEEDKSPRFRDKPIEVSLYEKLEDLGVNPVFEGQTSSISREGMGARVNPKGDFRSVSHEELEGMELVIQFHTAVRDTPNPVGKVEMSGESHDMRYEVYLGFTFKEELPLHNLFR